MEGKPGILVVLIVLDVLLLVAGVVFGVLFAIKQTIVFADYNINLYFAIGLVSMFVIASACTITARNARITADNTYDILRHVELLVKKEGISLTDLALRDQKTAAKIAKKVEAEKLKEEKKEQERKLQEEKAEAKILEEEAKAKERAEAEAKKAEAQEQAASVPVQSAPVQEEAPVQEDAQPETQPEAQPEEAQPEEEVVEYSQDSNCNIEYKDWKAALEGKITCGECNSPYMVRQTKSGLVVVLCQGAKKENGCSQNKALPVKQLADQFLDWFEQFYGERPEYFSLEDFNAKVEGITIKDKVCTFTAKLAD